MRDPGVYMNRRTFVMCAALGIVIMACFGVPASAAGNPPPGCSLKAVSDQPQYFWGQVISVTGNAIDCPNGIKVKLGEAPQGPELKVTVAPQNSGIPEGFDLATGMAGTDSSFAFSLDTNILKQEYGLADGDYTIYIVSLDAENRYAKVPVHLGVLGSPTCSMSINNIGKYDNTWGDKLTFWGIAENCPNGVQFHLTKDVTMPLPGIEIGGTKQVSDATYTWIWDSGQTRQKYSLPDGIYSVRVTDSSGAPMAAKVDVNMTTPGGSPAACNHYVYALSTNGTGMPTGVSGVDILISGYNSRDGYDNYQNIVSVAKTGPDGFAVLSIGNPNLAKWRDFHVYPKFKVNLGDSPPPGYGFSSSMESFTSLKICGGSSQFWYWPVSSPSATQTPVPFSTETPVPFIREEQFTGSGGEGQAPSFLSGLFSLPTVIMSFVGMQPPDLGKPVSDQPSQDSVSVGGIYPPPDINGQAVTGNDHSGAVQVVVLPGSAGSSTGSDGSKIATEPEIIIRDSGTGMNQVHLIDTTTPVPAPALPPEAVMNVPTTSIAAEPGIVSPASLPCPNGNYRCFGMCTDLLSDPLHCGSCNITCPFGTTCVSGTCAVQCPSGTSSCNGACFNLMTDTNNCGSCGHICMTGVACTNGQCVAQMVTTQPTRLGGYGIRGY
jgi:hypothetical protein